MKQNHLYRHGDFQKNNQQVDGLFDDISKLATNAYQSTVVAATKQLTNIGDKILGTAPKTSKPAAAPVAATPVAPMDIPASSSSFLQSDIVKYGGLALVAIAVIGGVIYINKTKNSKAAQA